MGRPGQAGDTPAKGAERGGLSSSLAEGSRPFVYKDAETHPIRLPHRKCPGSPCSAGPGEGEITLAAAPPLFIT